MPGPLMALSGESRPGSRARRYTFIATDYKPKPGGIAAYLDTLARGLIRLGADVHVLAVIPPDDRDRLRFLTGYEPWVTPFRVSYDRRPQNRIASGVVSVLEMMRCLQSPTLRRLVERTRVFDASVRSINQLQQMLNPEQSQMVVFGHLDLNLYPFALFLAERRIPYGIIAHDFEVRRYSGRLNDTVRRGMMLRRAAWIVANSQHTRSLLNPWRLPSHKLIVVHPPVAEEAIRGGHLHKTNAGGRYNLITICRLVRSKGIDIVLRALKILDAAGVPFEYVVVGDGGERQSLERMAHALGIEHSVRFMGSVCDEAKWPLLQRADVFVMPSRVDSRVQHEGFGIGFIEAAAFGVPGVGSTGGGIPEAVMHGKTGLLVPEDSPEQLASALMFLYTNPETRQAMAATGFARARSEFAPTAIATHFDHEVGKCVTVQTNQHRG